MASAATASAVHDPAGAAASGTAAVTGNSDRVGGGHQQTLPDAGFDGMAVAGIGTGLAGAGWLLMFLGSRQLRRRSR
jgi:hypothetical protein